jgi:tRNA A-37 threonylcarbamoyl transferase component Bud32
MTSVVDRLSAAVRDRYRVEREIGSGGMATVYLARDLRHERRVAIKVLHPELGAVLGGDRFLSEIKTTAHLQHPNILQLFDSGIADGLLYYVMPFVEGETLRHRLTREKQLPIDDAVAIARGAAAALDYAHRHGIIHRDIKPENILLQDGQALVADFGIALAVKQAGGARLTQTGLSLGTPQYMSPEQATGERDLDARSDVYALGAVSYEMLAGEAPFTGNTTQAIVAKLMTEEPRPVSVLRRSVPPHVAAAVHQALEKLPADRFGSAVEFAAALAGATAARPPVGRSGARGARRSTSRLPLLPLGIVAVALLALGLLAGRWSAARRAPVTASRLAILPPAQTGIVNAGLARILDISQDGQLVAFAVSGAANDFVALRRLDEAIATAMPNSGGVRNLHVSPDGRFLYAPRSTSTIQRAPLGGGSWTPVTAVPATAFLAWSADGSIWWTPQLGGGVYRLHPGASKPEQPFPDTTGIGPVIQQLLPGARSALVVASGATNSGLAGVLDLRTGRVTTLFDFPVVELRYTSGLLVYVRPDNTLSAVEFDAGSGKVTGEPLLLSDDVALTGAGIAQFAVSATGTLIYLPSFGRELMLVDRSGRAVPLLDAKLNYHSPRFSPDGKLVALDNVSADGRDVWIFDRAQQQLSRTTFDRDGHDPVWSLDGKAIYYLSQRRGPMGIYRVRPGGGGTPDSLVVNGSIGATGAALRAGTVLLSTATDLNGRSGTDVALVHLGPPSRIEALFASPFDEGWAVPSPNEQWVAFTSDETGRQEVYVHPLSLEGTRVQISVDGGSEPVWARNGRELFYRRPTAGQVRMMVAELALSPEPRVVKRSDLFDASDFEPAQPHANYDVAPDGQSFVMLRRSPSSHIVVIQNLPELMRRSQRQGTR